MIISKYEDVTLREFEEDDIPQKVKWINNSENNTYLRYDLPLDINKTIDWFRNKDNSKRVDCIIEYNNTPVGLVGLIKVDKINKKAECYITIGETNYKRKGIAVKSTIAIVNYAFDVLKLHLVYITIDARNVNSIKTCKKSGFKQEGQYSQDGKPRLYFEIRPEEKYQTAIKRMGYICENEIFIKRDDSYPYSFGGNKARKAELYFKEIDKGNYDCVVTYGSRNSNHCRIVSNLCAARGLPCFIISPEGKYDPTFNSEMMEFFGAKITTVPVDDVHETIEQMLSNLSEEGKRPYFIAGGGHGTLGTQAYVDCYEEIRDYEIKKDIHFDYVFLASGTGTTQAGLVCGQLLHKDERDIVGISMARKNPRGRNIVLESIKEYFAEKEFAIDEAEIQNRTIFIDNYTGDGYGRGNKEISDTIWNVMKQYGIPLDSIYTGKAFWGMKEYLKQQQISGKKVLFVHTGGTPLFFDELRNNNEYFDSQCRNAQ